MKPWTVRRTTGLLSLSVFLLGTVALFGQDRPNQDPVPPSDILGPQLIAWSLLQRPQPVPQPMPGPNQQMHPQEQQEANPPGQQQESSTQTFTGTIGKDGSHYVLKVSNNSAYQLDDQERAKQYEGKQVRVNGTLNPKDNSLHVLNIELIS